MGTVDQGRDTYCVDSLVPGRMATGKQLYAQRCYHRLITPTGTLRGGEEEADFGMDLAGYVGSTDNAAIGSALPVRVENELMKDPVTVSAKCTATRVESGGEVSWDLSVALESTLGDVRLIMNVSAVTVQLLGVT